MNGQRIVETDNAGNKLKEYVYLNGQPLALSTHTTQQNSLLTQAMINHKWVTLDYPDQPQPPVIIAGPPSYNGPAPGVVRLRNVTANRAEIRFQKWPHHRGKPHATEDLSLLILPPGRHTQADGSIWEVGTLRFGGTAKWRQHKFSKPFPKPPQVFLTAQSYNGKQAITVRAKAVTTDGFQAALFEQDSKQDSGHFHERIGYLAIYSPTQQGSAVINGETFNYQLSTATLTHVPKTIGNHSLFLEEEQSEDEERLHTTETLAILSSNGHIFAQDISAIGPDTIAIRRRSPLPAANAEMVSGLYYIHPDHLGTPEKLTDDSQQVVWSASYTPFGQVTINEDVGNDSNTITFDMRAPGQWYDAETGLSHNYFRDYDPNTGRYLQPDPIGVVYGGTAAPKYGQLNHLTYMSVGTQYVIVIHMA